jgi:hypothetical protein
MKNRTLALAVGVVASLLVSGSALAVHRGTYKISAALTAAAEVPAPSRASGTGSFSGKYVENKTGAVLTWTLKFSGLTGPASAAHIHSGKTGVAGNVIVPLCQPCTSPAHGKTTISKSVIATIESGGAYVNVHTGKNPAGEIRGQVKVSG